MLCCACRLHSKDLHIYTFQHQSVDILLSSYIYIVFRFLDIHRLSMMFLEITLYFLLLISSSLNVVFVESVNSMEQLLPETNNTMNIVHETDKHYFVLFSGARLGLYVVHHPTIEKIKLN